jgi:hypothetical protein
MKKYTRLLTGCDEVRQGKAKGAGVRHVSEWSIEIWPKPWQDRGFILSFIFAMSLCLIRV